MKYYSFKSHQGFTLAETIVALVVIGVIVVITVPILLNNTQDKELVQKWKKAYSTISNSTEKINSGFDDLDLTNNFTLRTSYEKALNYIQEGYLHDLGTSQYCYYKNDSNSNVFNMDNVPSIVLSDGTVVAFYYASTDCSWNPSGLTVCGLMYVDVNAKKPPNMFGKDLYGIWLVRADKSS